MQRNDLAPALPIEMGHEIRSHLDTHSLLMFGFTCKQQLTELHTYTNSAPCWMPKLIEAGCPQALLMPLLPFQSSINYLKIYNGFKKLKTHEIACLSAPWELLCLSGDRKMVKLAKDHFGLTILSRSKLGYSAMHYVILNAGKNYQESIIGICDDFNDRYQSMLRTNSKDGVSSLHLTIRANNIKLMSFLQHYLHVGNMSHCDIHGRHAFHYAAWGGAIEILDDIAKNRSQYGMISAWPETDRNSIHIRDKNDLTALHYAVMSGNPATVIKLMELGVNPELKDATGATAEDYCEFSANPELMKKVFESQKTNLRSTR